MSSPIAAVFGWAEATPGSQLYEDGVTLGRGLVERGYTVRCGGYFGLMEAVARGARSAGGECHGVTVEVFEGKAANAFLSSETKERDLLDRLRTLITGSDVCIAQLGSLGTLAEVTVAWCLRYLGDDTVGPIHLVGPEWRSVVESYGGLRVKPNDLDLVAVHDTVHAALDAVEHVDAARPDDRPHIDFATAVGRLHHGLAEEEPLEPLIRSLGSHAPEEFAHDVAGGLELQQVPVEVAGLLEHIAEAFRHRSDIRYLEIGLGSCGTIVLMDAFLRSKGIEVDLFGVDDLSYERAGWLQGQAERIAWCQENLGMVAHIGRLQDEVVRRALAARSYDVIFVDGDHSLAGCLLDVVTALPWLRADGILVLHDIVDPRSPGVATVYEFVRPLFGSSSTWVASDACGIAALSGSRVAIDPAAVARLLVS